MSHSHSDSSVSHTSHKKPPVPFIIAGVVALIALIGLGTFLSVTLQNSKKQLADLTTKQITTSQKIIKTYDEVLNLWQNYEKIVIEETEEVSEDSLLLQKPSEARTLAQAREQFKEKQYIQPGEAVLGIEDSGVVRVYRRIEDQYSNGITLVEALEEQNEEIKKLYASPVGMFLPAEQKDAVAKTEAYIQNAKPIFVYFKARSELELESLFLGVGLYDSIIAAVDSNGSDTTMKKLKEQVLEVERLEREYVGIDISEIPDSLQKQHADYAKDYVALKAGLQKIVEGIEAQDLNTFMEGSENLDQVSSGDITQVQIVSFWKNDSYRKDLEAMKKSWEKGIQSK